MGFDKKETDQLLARCGRRCCICGLLHAVQVHHIHPREKGGSDNIENGIPLCPNCHDAVHTGYSSGKTTKIYTATELKLHRQRTIDQVRNIVNSASGNSIAVSNDPFEIAQYSNLISIENEYANPFIPRLFLHFLGIHFLEYRGIRLQHKEMFREARLATRMALLAADNVFITIASRIESPICAIIVSQLQEFCDLGFVHFIGNGASLNEFIFNKLEQYPRDSYQFKAYSSFLSGLQPPFHARTASATKDISESWYYHLEYGKVPSFFETRRYSPPTYIEERWAKIPELLGEKAFIVDYVAPILFKAEPNIHELNSLHKVINSFYFDSFTSEFKCGVVTDLIRLEANHIIPSFGQNLPFSHVLKLMQREGLVGLLEKSTASELLTFRNSTAWKNILAESFMKHAKFQDDFTKYNTGYGDTMKNAQIQYVDVVILVALDEEYDQLIDLLPGETEPIKDKEFGGHDFLFSFPRKNKSTINCVTRFLGDMGPDKTGRVADRMISKWNPKIVVLIGIAASLHADVKLGDVVIAEQIDAYASNLKAVTGIDGDIKYLHRGSVYRAPHDLISEIKDFKFVHKPLYDSWIKSTLEDLEALISTETREQLSSDNQLGDIPSIYRVHLASGPVMSASVAYKNWLHSRDETIKALEMEAAGLVAAAFERKVPVTALVVRGISDFGDDKKNALDKGTKNSIRKLAMRNATRLVFSYMQAGIILGEQ